jgi:hypothetical protein
MGLADEIDDAVERHLTARKREASIAPVDSAPLLEEAQRLRLEIIELGQLLDDVLGELAAGPASSSG